MWKVKNSSWRNQLRRSAGKFRPLYMLLAGNDTVPISVWCAIYICAVPSAVYLCCRVYANVLPTGSELMPIALRDDELRGAGFF